MRADHIRVLLKAALKFGCEIVVRTQNPLSVQYMGKSRFKPKPLLCHAKTAGNASGPKQLQGLVVDPTLFPEAFEHNKLKKAKSEWENFKTNYLNHGLGFKLNDVVDSQRYGCLLFHGDYLYSDYDLKSVTPFFGENPVLKDQQGRPGVASLEMKYHRNAPRDYTTNLENKIQKYFRERTGIALIQHGAEKNIPDFVSSSELCDVFYPCAPFHIVEFRGA